MVKVKQEGRMAYVVFVHVDSVIYSKSTSDSTHSMMPTHGVALLPFRDHQDVFCVFLFCRAPPRP